MKTFPTEWAINVYRVERPQMSGGIITQASTLPEALAIASTYATFYAGPLGTRVQLEERCATCHGTGIVGRTRRMRPLRCKACRGNSTVSVLGYLARVHRDCGVTRGGEVLVAEGESEERRTA